MSSNPKARPSFPFKSRVLLICSTNLPFELDLATHHALNPLYTISPLEFCSFVSSQSVRFLPKLSPTHSDFFLLWEFAEGNYHEFYTSLTCEFITSDCQLRVVISSLRTKAIYFHLSIPPWYLIHNNSQQILVWLLKPSIVIKEKTTCAYVY